MASHTLPGCSKGPRHVPKKDSQLVLKRSLWSRNPVTIWASVKSMQFLNPYYCFLSFNKHQPDAYSVPCSIPARAWLQAKVKQGNAKFFLFQLLSAFFGWLSRRKGYSPSSKLNYLDFQQFSSTENHLSHLHCNPIDCSPRLLLKTLGIS